MLIPGPSETSLAGRLPDDLRGTAADVEFGALPFEPLYRTDTSSPRGVEPDRARGDAPRLGRPGRRSLPGQMAVYVKPRGLFGKGYMALIKPFRYLIVYPALTRQTGGCGTRAAASGGAQSISLTSSISSR